MDLKGGIELRKDIAYAPGHGFRGLADILLPPCPKGSRLPLAIVIHGGGWNAMDKTALQPIAHLFAEAGFATFSPNYRLLDDAPWPACLDDCLTAVSFILDNAAALGIALSNAPIVIVGASAGGHLAMMTGLRLPKGRVGHIVSMAGPSDMEDILTDKEGILKLPPVAFFGKEPSEEDWNSASPLRLFKPGCPPLTCIQSSNDKLVPPSHSEKAVAKCREAGVSAELISFEGKDILHGFWLPGPQGQLASERSFLPVLEEILRKLAGKLRKDAAAR